MTEKRKNEGMMGERKEEYLKIKEEIRRQERQ